MVVVTGVAVAVVVVVGFRVVVVVDFRVVGIEKGGNVNLVVGDVVVVVTVVVFEASMA